MRRKQPTPAKPYRLQPAPNSCRAWSAAIALTALCGAAHVCAQSSAQPAAASAYPVKAIRLIMAAADASSRAVMLGLMALKGEMG